MSARRSAFRSPIYMPMTAVPQRTAISHACGALASALIGTAEYYRRAASRLRDGRAGSRDAAGISDLHRKPDGVRKAAGVAADAADHLRGQNFVNLGVFGLAVDHRYRAHRLARANLAVSDFLGACAGVRSAADRPDRRRRYAHRHRAAEFLRRAFGQRDGFRTGQQTADCGGRARWLFGFHSLDHHVPGDEPVLYQRAVRRFWTDSDEREANRRRARFARPRRKKRRRFWTLHATSSSFRAMEWRWRKRNTSCARCTTC